MGVMKRLNEMQGMSRRDVYARANEKRAERGKRGFIEVTISKNDLNRINRILAKLEDDIAIMAYDEGLKAAGKVVADRASEKAPRGDRSKQSKKAKARWSQTPLSKLIKVKVVGKGKRTKTNPVALVGAKFPDGNQIHFVHPMAGKNGKGKATKQQVYWGKNETTVRKQNDFLKRAFDETKGAQVRAFTRAMIRRIRRELGKERGRS